MGTTTTEIWAWKSFEARTWESGSALEGGEIVLGNVLHGNDGNQPGGAKGSSPKRMAAKQAKIDRGNGMLLLRDLDSPGGTFLNTSRLLAGETRPLAEGDVIQVGGVQLKVVSLEQVHAPANQPAQHAEPAHPVAPPPPHQARTTSPVAHVPGNGGFHVHAQRWADCRNRDDFLTASAKPLGVVSPRVGIGTLGELLGDDRPRRTSPSPFAGGSPDDRLDAWLAPCQRRNRTIPSLKSIPTILSLRRTRAV